MIGAKLVCIIRQPHATAFRVAAAFLGRRLAIRQAQKRRTFMWQEFLAWLSRRGQPRVWTVRDRYAGLWHKAVTYRRPQANRDLANGQSEIVQGPFRSEVDAEDFCDRMNLARQGKFDLYNIPALPASHPTPTKPKQRDC